VKRRPGAHGKGRALRVRAARAAAPRRTATRAPGEIEERKAEHLRLASGPEAGSRLGPGWSDVHLLHHALPVADLAAIDLSTEFLGRRLRAPLVVSAMTGGHRDAREINAVLARAAQRHGLAMGLGSQRAALREPRLARTYAVAREVAPDAFLIANIGAAQLVAQDSGPGLTPREISDAVAMIHADALAIHLNFLEEAVQPEGDRRAAGLREAIAGAVACAGVPVIAKETGAGLSHRAALELRELGVSALDVGGLGGTSFAAIEAARARARGDLQRARLGEAYRDWGIPTAAAIAAARAAGLPLIATGGVRTGLDAAKAIALGATLAGVARPLLLAALAGEAAVDAWIEQFLGALRLAIFLTAGRSVADLRSAPRVILGKTRRWLEALGLEASP